MTPPEAATLDSASDTHRAHLPAAPSLSRRTRFSFAAQGFFDAAIDLVVLVFLGKFYVDVLLVPPGLVALAIAAARAFDAVIDPMMGFVSDHTRSRFGRRKPWIAVGSAGSALVFYALLAPPAALSTRELSVWFAACFILFFLFTTIVRVPKGALGAELTFDPAERVRLFGLVTIFVAVGLLVSTLGPTVLERGLGVTDPRAQMAALGLACALGTVLTHALLLHGVAERSDFQERGRAPFVPGVRRVLRNRPFVVLLLCSIAASVPAFIPATLMPFFVQYVLHGSAELGALYILVYFVSGFVALPFWLRMAARHGKLRVWLINGAIGVTGGAAMFLVGPGDSGLMFVLEVFVGLQSQVWLVLVSAMQADAIDYDELLTGKRREAQFGALSAIVPKFTLIPGAAIPLAILGNVGYVPNAEQQTPEVVLTLRLLFALVPAAFNLVGLLIMRRYPLSEARHAQVRVAVGEHAQGRTVEDPLTGRRLPPPGAGAVDETTSWFLDHFSQRELRALAAGRSPLGSVLAWCGVSLVLTLIGAAAAVATAGTLETDPGPWPSLAIVLAGASLTALLFHALRLRPALRLRESPIARELVERHLSS